MNKPINEHIEFIETIECEACYRLIDVRASRCPHCCSYLEKSPRVRIRQLKTVVIALAVVGIIGWAAFWVSYNKEAQVVPAHAPVEPEVIVDRTKPSPVAPQVPAKTVESKQVVESTDYEPEIIEPQSTPEYDAELVQRILDCKINVITSLSCYI